MRLKVIEITYRRTTDDSIQSKRTLKDKTYTLPSHYDNRENEKKMQLYDNVFHGYNSKSSNF